MSAPVNPIDGQKFNVDIDKLKPNPYQKRKLFDEGKLQELANGIKSKGFFGSIIVSAIPNEPGYFYIVAGERRVRAMKMLSNTTIPAELKQMTDEDLEDICAIENLQRENLSPMEEAQTYQGLYDRHGSIEAVAEKTGKARQTIESRIALLKLEEPVRDLVDDGKLSLDIAGLLTSVDDPDRQIKMARAAVAGRMDSNRFRAMLQQSSGDTSKKGSNEGKPAKPMTAGGVTREIVNLTDALERFDQGSAKPEELANLRTQFDALVRMLTTETIPQLDARIQGVISKAA